MVLKDLGEFFGGGTSIGRLLVHLVGRDRGLNKDINFPRNPFDLVDLVQFLATVFWRAMRISTWCTRQYPVGRASSFGTRGGGPCRKCLAHDGFMVYSRGDSDCGLVWDLDELDLLEACLVKTLSSIACWHAILKLACSLPYDLFHAADSDPSLYYLGAGLAFTRSPQFAGMIRRLLLTLSTHTKIIGPSR
jgi:hypothetical protein